MCEEYHENTFASIFAMHQFERLRYFCIVDYPTNLDPLVQSSINHTIDQFIVLIVFILWSVITTCTNLWRPMSRNWLSCLKLIYCHHSRSFILQISQNVYHVAIKPCCTVCSCGQTHNANLYKLDMNALGLVELRHPTEFISFQPHEILKCCTYHIPV